MPKPLDRIQRNREYDTKRKAEHPWRAWYGTASWQAIRAAQLAKQPLCERCARSKRTVMATVAHHRTPHKGDAVLFWDAGNLASSCAPCHDTIDQGIEARGYEVGCDVDGRPLASDHPWNRKA